CLKRQTLGNGTLYFPPFRAEDYRADVHSTVYRCKASNLGGAILSRDVKVRAVLLKFKYVIHVADIMHWTADWDPCLSKLNTETD
ncbi:hypothetical protein L9F63_006414, partial [Diploptera punctata]